MSPNSFHTKMRGERPFNLNDIDHLASALEADALLLLRFAAGRQVSSDEVEPVDFTPIDEEPLRAVAKKKSSDRGGDDGRG